MGSLGGLATTKCGTPFECFEIIVEPANKGVTKTTETTLNFIEAYHYRMGSSSLFTLNEAAIKFSRGFGFKKFSPFYETLNDKIGHLLAAGLFKENWGVRRELQKKKPPDAVGLQVLTMDHLELAFIACLIPLGLAEAVFLMEIIFHVVKKYVWKHNFKCC